MVKLMICGHGRHGKDTVAEYLRDKYKYTFESSSHICLDLFIYDALKGKFKYKSKEECYEDRINKRDEWYNLITAYCQKHPTKLTSLILKDNDIYVGIRNKNEFLASKHLVNYTIWVDRSEVLPPESESSNQITSDMCNVYLDNNKDLNYLYKQIDELIKNL